MLLNSLNRTHGIRVAYWKRGRPITHNSQNRNLPLRYSIRLCAWIGYVEDKLLCFIREFVVDARWAHIPHVL